jgi:hypothetical protein
MSPIVIEVPDLAVSVDTERPIQGATRVRVYFGPEIEVVLTPATADRLVAALDDMVTDDRAPVVRAGWVR